jgi:hypothetical protein
LSRGGLKGDPRTLREYARHLVRTVGVSTAQEIARRAAPELTTQALASFDAQRTPYGDPWEPGHDGKDVDLVESGGLRRTLKFEPIGTRMRAVLAVKHARFQVGKRSILPPGGRTLPTSWKVTLERISRDVIGERLGGS